MYFIKIFSSTYLEYNKQLHKHIQRFVSKILQTIYIDKIDDSDF